MTDFLNKPLDNTKFLARANKRLALRRSHQIPAIKARFADKEIELRGRSLD